MIDRLLLCSDLDRTLLPNGAAPESPGARDLFGQLAGHPRVHLAYVSGRDLALVESAIAEYNLPQPHFVLGDVGASMFQRKDGRWERLEDWGRHIAADWQGRAGRDLQEWLADIDDLTLQEETRQQAHKLSYFTPADIDSHWLRRVVKQRLEPRGIRSNLIWSLYEKDGKGLLDILPQRAGKLEAVRFLMKKNGFSEENTLFAGDSGNDLDVMVSSLKSVLVANAREAVRREALSGVANPETLYLARGGFRDMNGNYSAGVLEGVDHFFPEFFQPPNPLTL